MNDTGVTAVPSPPCVLVVDDVADSREMLADWLSALGFRVATASDGAEALTQAEEFVPDLVLMDLALPGPCDGWEATRRIRSNPLLRRTVVIAVTAHAFPQHHQRAMHAGCQMVLTKPLDMGVLETHVRRVTERSQLLG